MPMPAVVGPAPGLPWPRHHMGNPRGDILITSRAHVEFGGRGAAHLPDHIWLTEGPTRSLLNLCSPINRTIARQFAGCGSVSPIMPGHAPLPPSLEERQLIRLNATQSLIIQCHTPDATILSESPGLGFDLLGRENTLHRLEELIPVE